MNNVKDVEIEITKLLKELFSEVPKDNYIQWKSFFEKVKFSTLSDEDKLLKYYVLLDNIEALQEAQYMSKPINILRQTIIASTNEIVEKTKDVLNYSKYVLPLVLAFSILLVGAYVLKR
jgi:hypothetical protein